MDVASIVSVDAAPAGMTGTCLQVPDRQSSRTTNRRVPWGSGLRGSPDSWLPGRPQTRSAALLTNVLPQFDLRVNRGQNNSLSCHMGRFEGALEGLYSGLGAWPTTRLAAPWWEAVPVWMPFFRTEWDGQAF